MKDSDGNPRSGSFPNSYVEYFHDEFEDDES